VSNISKPMRTIQGIAETPEMAGVYEVRFEIQFRHEPGLGLRTDLRAQRLVLKAIQESIETLIDYVTEHPEDW